MLGALNQVGTQRMAFDVAADRLPVLVRCDGKGLEPTLVEMAGAGRVLVRVPAHAMGVREPAAKGA